MKIELNTVMIEDRSRALKFYTEVLGFVKQKEVVCRKSTQHSAPGAEASRGASDWGGAVWPAFSIPINA